ncbi:uncharacterized protein LOC107787862 [Nicotiana tabacum]|uniref:Uncharacterized protein LOC107787862 n=1 Tax=Nicotiana tabacum TaxID=4097 RepID=A0AC58TK86_TOBAC
MVPDKKWMELIHDRLGNAYKLGVDNILDFAFTKLSEARVIRCPCIKCCNTSSGTREMVKSHLIVHGIIQNYTFWYHHGEKLGEPQSNSEDVEDDDIEEAYGEDEIHGILRDLYLDFDADITNIDGDDFLEEEPNLEAKKFYRLLKDFEQPLYQNSKVSKLSTMVKLLHIKSIGRWSYESFTMLLKMLKEDLLTAESNLPDSYYEAKKIIRDLGLSYKKIDACKNNCMLYWKDDKFLESCKVCGASRWKEDKHRGETKFKNGKKIAHKILRYFPLKPILQRLFMSSKISSLMTWNHEKRVDDGMMRHSADSMAWKKFDELHQSFAAEPRNVRLGLASDGFQPFGSSRTPYNIWPVVLIPYNLPSWLCMKQENFILSMLIPGPESPGDAIDVYLQPLMDELKELWETGVETFDASTKQSFILHAALLWNINDFPAYANLSRWSKKGKLACPCCNKEISSIRLENGKKQCYMGHRRFLPLNHKWRNDKQSFDGAKERRLPPKVLSGEDILNQVADLDGLLLTKDLKKKPKISHESRSDNCNKKSISFGLPYWKTLLLRHNLDVMHIEKNVCDNM